MNFDDKHGLYHDFKKAYPLNGSALNPEVFFFLQTLEREEPEECIKIIAAAKEFDTYCRQKYGKSYPHIGFIPMAINWLEKRQWHIHWLNRLPKTHSLWDDLGCTSNDTIAQNAKEKATQRLGYKANDIH